MNSDICYIKVTTFKKPAAILLYLQAGKHALSNALRHGAYQLKQLKIDMRLRPYLHGLDITGVAERQ